MKAHAAEHADILMRYTATNPLSPRIKGTMSSAAGAGSSAKFPPLPYIFSSLNTNLLAGRKTYLIEPIPFIATKREMGKK